MTMTRTELLAEPEHVTHLVVTCGKCGVAARIPLPTAETEGQFPIPPKCCVNCKTVWAQDLSTPETKLFHALLQLRQQPPASGDAPRTIELVIMPPAAR